MTISNKDEKNPSKQQVTVDENPGDPPQKLTEGEDYYLENGFLVFTAKYHKKRGYCCNSGCRHCPYKV